VSFSECYDLHFIHLVDEKVKSRIWSCIWCINKNGVVRK